MNEEPRKSKDRSGSKSKLLRSELKKSAVSLQESVHISYYLLNEVHKLDNDNAGLTYDKSRLSKRNRELIEENQQLRRMLNRQKDMPSIYQNTN